MNRSTLLSSAAVLLFAGTSMGQNLLRYRPTAGLPLRERPLPSPAWTGSGPGRLLPHHAGPARALLSGPRGAVTINVADGVMLSTNGAGTIDRTEYSRTGLATGVVLPSLPFPAGVAQVNGMAFDPSSRHLFLTDGTTIYEVDPAAGMAVLFSFPASPMNTLAGLDFDRADPGHVYGVSTAGEVAIYDRYVGVMVSVTSPTYAWPGAEATGLALYKTAAPRRDFFVLHRNGDVYNHSTGVRIHNGLGGQVGMAYLPTPVHLPSSASGSEEVMTSAFVVDGEARFGFELQGLAAPAIPLGWAVSLMPPGGLVPLPVLCSDLWPDPATAFVSTSPGATAMPLPLPAGPIYVGTTLIAQPVVVTGDPTCPIKLLEAMHCEISTG